VEAEEIRQAVLATIESVAPDADVQGIPSDRPLRQAIELDSMDWLNVIAGLHDRLCIEIPESDYERLETVDAMVDYVAARQAHAMGEATLTKPETTLPLPRTQHLVRGTRVTVRPMSAEDMEREADFVRRLSAEARYNRFMVTVSELPQGKLNYLTDVDQQRHVALVATVDHAGQDVLVGVARYVVDSTGTGCEFAIAVDDAWQACGLGGILMHALMGVARSRGLATMEGLVLRANTRMLRFARQLGFKRQRNSEDRDTVRVVRALLPMPPDHPHASGAAAAR
jgi:acetyltransferase